MAKLILFIVFFLFASCSSLPRNYTELKTNTPIQLNDILTSIENRRAIFVGELHATDKDQRVQLEVIKHLNTIDKKVVIAFELFPGSKQGVLNRWIDGSLPERAFSRVFQETVNLPFGHYRKIFSYARNAKIPIIGINAEKSLVTKVSRKGVTVVPGELLQEIRFSSCSEDPEYERLIGFSESRDYHVTGMPFLCDAQRFRDAFMAYMVSKILGDKNVTVIVLVGSAHAAKVAVPKMLQNFRSLSPVVLVTRQISIVTNSKPDAAVADYIWY